MPVSLVLPVAGGMAIGAGISAAGSALGGKGGGSSQKASQFTPPDSRFMREQMFGDLSQLMATPGTTLPELLTPVQQGLGSQALQSQLMNLSSPQFMQDMYEKFDPNAVIQSQYQALLPQFQNDLKEQLANTRTQLGMSGNRFSSDAARIISDQIGTASNDFYGQFAKQLPTLQGQQIGALGMIPSLQQGTGGALGSLLGVDAMNMQQRQLPLQFLQAMATSGVGGAPGASSSSAGSPYLGAAMQGAGAGMQMNYAWPMIQKALAGG